MASLRTSNESEGIAFLEKDMPNNNRLHVSHLTTKFLVIVVFLHVFVLAAAISCYSQLLSSSAAYLQTYGYSPLYQRIPLKPYQTTINGTIWPSVDSGPARQLPNPIDEAIWDEWEAINVIPITSAEIKAMGKDPATAAKLEDSSWSLGNDAYAGVLDVFHQIHCLNQLRKLAYRDYYDAKIANADPENITMHEIHTNHCIDILLQALQCSGNLQIATMHWTETQLYPFPDMSIERQCVDFAAITEWRRKNSINMEHYKKVMQKDKQLNPVKEKSIEQGYWDLFGNEI